MVGRWSNRAKTRNVVSTGQTPVTSSTSRCRELNVLGHPFYTNSSDRQTRPVSSSTFSSTKGLSYFDIDKYKTVVGSFFSDSILSCQSRPSRETSSTDTLHLLRGVDVIFRALPKSERSTRILPVVVSVLDLTVSTVPSPVCGTHCIVPLVWRR